MARENIPTSRVVRSATIGRLAAGQAVRQFGTRAANLARGDEASDAALARRQVETAEQIVAVLGTMKGAAMKLGQVMSFLDVGLVPEEYREEFQAKLAELRDSAPHVSFKEMRKVIETEFDEPLDELFAHFDPEPIAAAITGRPVSRRNIVPNGASRCRVDPGPMWSSTLLNNPFCTRLTQKVISRPELGGLTSE